MKMNVIIVDQIGMNVKCKVRDAGYDEWLDVVMEGRSVMMQRQKGE